MYRRVAERRARESKGQLQRVYRQAPFGHPRRARCPSTSGKLFDPKRPLHEEQARWSSDPSASLVIPVIEFTCTCTGIKLDPHSPYR